VSLRRVISTAAVSPGAGQDPGRESETVRAREGSGAPPAAREPMRVLVADHSPSMRAGVRLALETDDCVVCGEAGDAGAAVEAALRERPDLRLVDADLPRGGGAAVAEITSKLPGTRVVVFSDSRGETDLLAALRAGAWGYLYKDIDLARLPTALQRVLEGEPALPRALVARLIDELRDTERRRALGMRHNLSHRELEVLELLSENLTTAEIAGRLFVARVTVRTHIASILKKLGVPTREEAIRLLERR
jgi:two-component system, NarL family, nitrate/nitrite response regulator NarL